MSTRLKTAKEMERHFKGVANHHRINILLLIEVQEGITVVEIAKSLHANFKTISQHTRSLLHSGLIKKRYRGQEVMHSLSSYGKAFIRFVKEVQKLT